MKRLAVLFVVGLVLGAVAAPVGAAPKPKLPKITGGGQATNNNSGSTAYPNQIFQFGFTAQATGAGVTHNHAVFPASITVYPARGEFQARSYDAGNPSTTVAQGHGEVVCMANYGPPGPVDAGGLAGTVWEVRVGFEHPTLGTVYGSFMMQDNGSDDYIDESFSNPFDDDCGETTFFQLEAVTQGNIQVH